MEKFKVFYFPSKCFVSFDKEFFFLCSDTKPSPIILPWHPSKDTVQRAKQGNKVNKTPGPEGLGLGGWFNKSLQFFLQRYLDISKDI